MARVVAAAVETEETPPDSGALFLFVADSYLKRMHDRFKTVRSSTNRFFLASSESLEFGLRAIKEA